MAKFPTLLVAAAVAALTFPVHPVHADVTGKPRVISGDELEVAGQRFRLWGVDAPELGQSCVAKDREFAIASMWQIATDSYGPSRSYRNSCATSRPSPVK